jgi:hypothetical protein
MEIQPYTATPEMVSSAKMELSVLSPHSEQAFINYVPAFQEQLMAHYGLHIPEDTELLNNGLAERIIVTSQEGLTRARKLWSPGSEIKRQKDMKTQGFHSPINNMIFLTHPRFYRDLYWKNASPDTKKDWIKHTGSAKIAKEELNGLIFTNTLFHEIIHAYENLEHNGIFSEGGVNFYLRQICSDESMLQYVKPNDTYEFLGNLYGRFVNNYGDTMHEIFFGEHVAPDYSDAIQNQFITIVKHAIL